MKTLDLQKDFNDVTAFLTERVKSFDPTTNPGPGDGERVSRIDVGFGVDQSGWVCVVFDTRDDAEPDGDWNEFIEETGLERPHWHEAYKAVATRPLTLIMPDGHQRDLDPGDSYRLIIALVYALRSVLIQGCDSGLLATLPKTTPCELGVEEQNGVFAWPKYESRGTDNYV